MRAPGRLPALLGDPAFRRYRTGQTVSLFGDRITQLALPLLAVLALDAGATQTGRLTAAGLLPSLLFCVVGTSTAGVPVQLGALPGLAWVLPSRTPTAPQRDETGSRAEAGGRVGVPATSAVSPGTCRSRAPRRRDPLPKKRGSAS